ncbi:MAG: hypothetical protein SFY66_23535 [Oculatellaceae cyanobacterium bins.114]|nr:hypothetical protein [Oculatellaceae cyanobacterium bins.114]
MMLVTQKRLLTGARKSRARSRLCLVITFEDGIRVQHPVENESEAIALFAHYSKLHPFLQKEVVAS